MIYVISLICLHSSAVPIIIYKLVLNIAKFG